jgi:hypothetical protein
LGLADGLVCALSNMGWMASRQAMAAITANGVN